MRMLQSILLAGCVCFSVARAAQLPFDLHHAKQDLRQTSFLQTPAPSPDTFRPVHLSHSGLYLDSPISRGAPAYISLHLDVPLYNLEDVVIQAGVRKRRDWEQVNLRCGSIVGGGIEECEKQDIREAKGANVDGQSMDCKPARVVREQARILLSAKSCPVLATILERSDHRSTAEESMLESVTLTFDVRRLVPTRRERHHFWLGRLSRANRPGPDGGALWPFAGTAHAGNDSTSVRYDGLIANRIFSLMQDPYFPRAAKPDSFDPLNGVDLTFASWSYGISIRVPSNGNHSKPTDPEIEPVHAPVAGQVVWLGEYSIPRAPGNHRNDESGIGVMIRDEWGMVYQLLGLSEPDMRIKLGQTVLAGQRIGGASRTPLSWEPPCRHKPADPPKMDDDSRRYPFRWRQLRIMVARPDPAWSEWKAPLESGWQYFNPLDAFTRAGRQSNINPDPNPSQMFFAEPSEDGALTPPNIVASTKDLFQPPRLSGETEVIVAFDAFMNTPGDPGDSMDLMSLHALDYSVVPVTPSPGDLTRTTDGLDSNPHDMYTCDNVPPGTVWRTAFEHSKLPNAWSVSLPKTALLGHYVPAFTVGSVPWFKTKYASQYDEKSRKLYYAPTRILVGQTDGRGAWDTRKEPEGDGLYQVWVRGRDWFGNQGCFGANVRIRNGA